MGLDTLDETKPYDTDLVSSGDDEIRLTRAATKQSFGFEHNLAGPHKFIVGSTAARPAAGYVGRLYINSDTRNIEYDNGSVWIPTQVNTGQILITSVNQIQVLETVWWQTPPTGTDFPQGMTNNAETLQAEVTWNSRGGHWMAWATMGGIYPVTISNARVHPRFVARLRLDSSAGSATGGTIVQAMVGQCGITDQPAGDPGAQIGLIFPWSSTLIHGGHSGALPPHSNTAPGQHRMTLTFQALDFVSPDPTGLAPTVTSRRVIVMEQG